MNADSVESVLRVLERAGFEALPKPLVIAGSSFDFDAAVRGTGASHDLVVLATRSTPAGHLVRLLSGLSRTLDQIGSRLPVSLVLIGGTFDPQTMMRLEQQSRVLAVDSQSPADEDIRRAVAVLLPLSLPSEQSSGSSPLAAVLDALGAPASATHQNFIDAAQFGPDFVRDALQKSIDAVAHGKSSDGGRL